MCVRVCVCVVFVCVSIYIISGCWTKPRCLFVSLQQPCYIHIVFVQREVSKDVGGVKRVEDPDKCKQLNDHFE